MLYLNKDFAVLEKKYDWGTLKFIELGEEGRGRKLIRLAVPMKFKEGDIIRKGLHEELTIGKTRAGKPRIIQTKDHYDNDKYAIIDTHGGYTRRHSGYFKILDKYPETEILAQANGADGDAGRIGSWDVVVVKLKDNTCAKVDYSGHYRDENHNFTYLMATKEGIFELWDGDYDDYLDNAEDPILV